MKLAEEEAVCWCYTSPDNAAVGCFSDELGLEHHPSMFYRRSVDVNGMTDGETRRQVSLPDEYSEDKTQV